MLATDTFLRLCRARDALREVHDPPVTVEAVARQVGMSAFQLIRQFSALFGTTPHQFRIHARIERAKYLLALGDHSVTDICMAIGCSSLGSFSHLFATRVGLPPSAYRRRARATINGRGAPPLFPGCLSLMAGAYATFEKH